MERCKSFAERPHAQPLPLPGLHPSSLGRVDSKISISVKSRLENPPSRRYFFHFQNLPAYVVGQLLQIWMEIWSMIRCSVIALLIVTSQETHATLVLWQLTWKLVQELLPAVLPGCLLNP